jgi:hypothetical protein
VPRRSAERRARPQADARGNADHPWRAPHWPAVRMRSSEVPVRIFLCASRRSVPLILLGRLSCSGLARLGREQKRAARTRLLILPREAGKGDHLAKQDGGRGAGLNASLSSTEFVESRAPPPSFRLRAPRFGGLKPAVARRASEGGSRGPVGAFPRTLPGTEGGPGVLCLIDEPQCAKNT